MNSPYEVEIKLKLDGPSLQILQDTLNELGAKIMTKEFQTDLYYDHPCREFTSTDEAFRFRLTISEASDELDELKSSEITYKGPKVDEETKTRLEESTKVEDAVSIQNILEHLGFKKVREVRKTRTEFLYEKATISLDAVENLGFFVEFELRAEDESKIETSREIIRHLICQLGLDPKSSIRESYLELLLAKD